MKFSPENTGRSSELADGICSRSQNSEQKPVVIQSSTDQNGEAHLIQPPQYAEESSNRYKGGHNGVIPRRFSRIQD